MYKVEILCQNGFTVNSIDFDTIGKAIKFVFNVAEHAAVGLKVINPDGKIILQKGARRYDRITEKSCY